MAVGAMSRDDISYELAVIAHILANPPTESVDAFPFERDDDPFVSPGDERRLQEDADNWIERCGRYAS